MIPFLAILFVLNYFCFLWRFEKSGFDNVRSTFNEKHFVDNQVLVNLSKLNRRLIELSYSFSAGVLLAHALQDVMLTRGRAQCVGVFQAGQNRNKQTSTNENTACESVLHLGHADRLPCVLICIPFREYWFIDCLARSGGSRGGARGARAPPLFWVKKEEMTEGKMADRASKSRPPPPPPTLAQGLDPPLARSPYLLLSGNYPCPLS